MLRALSVASFLVVALMGVYLALQAMKTSGPTSAPGQQAITQAQSSVAAANFAQADAAMQAFFTQYGTYSGAALPVGTGVVLVTAGATSYCLQAGDEHEVGPGGQPQPGSC